MHLVALVPFAVAPLRSPAQRAVHHVLWHVADRGHRVDLLSCPGGGLGMTPSAFRREYAPNFVEHHLASMRHVFARAWRRRPPAAAVGQLYADSALARAVVAAADWVQVCGPLAWPFARRHARGRLAYVPMPQPDWRAARLGWPWRAHTPPRLHPHRHVDDARGSIDDPLRALEDEALRASDVVFCSGTRLRDALRREGRLAREPVLLPPIHPEAWAPHHDVPTCSRERNRAKLRLGVSGPVVLCTGLADGGHGAGSRGAAVDELASLASGVASARCGATFLMLADAVAREQRSRLPGVLFVPPHLRQLAWLAADGLLQLRDGSPWQDETALALVNGLPIVSLTPVATTTSVPSPTPIARPRSIARPTAIASPTASASSWSADESARPSAEATARAASVTERERDAACDPRSGPRNDPGSGPGNDPVDDPEAPRCDAILPVRIDDAPQALRALIIDAAWRQQLGEHARLYAEQWFNPEADARLRLAAMGARISVGTRRATAERRSRGKTTAS